MAPQTKSAMQNAAKAINDFFSHHIPPSEIGNAWAQLKIHLITSATPQNSPPTSAPICEALEKIEERLILSEKRVTAPHNTAKTSLS
jgi:hypothetical protein